MNRTVKALLALVLTTCAKVDPAPPPRPTPAEEADIDADLRCTDRKWTPESVRASAMDAFDTEGVRGAGLADVPGVLPLFPGAWPGSSSCAVVTYLYYADEPEPVPGWGFDPESNGLSSPLLAAAKIDLRSGAVEVSVLDYTDAPLKPNWVRFGKRWRVGQTYDIVRQAEAALIEAVVEQEEVFDASIFEAYSRVWQRYPQYFKLLPPIHREFIDEMLRVRPFEQPKYIGGWMRPVERENNDGAP